MAELDGVGERQGGGTERHARERTDRRKREASQRRRKFRKLLMQARESRRVLGGRGASRTQNATEDSAFGTVTRGHAGADEQRAAPPPPRFDLGRERHYDRCARRRSPGGHSARPSTRHMQGWVRGGVQDAAQLGDAAPVPHAPPSTYVHTTGALCRTVYQGTGRESATAGSWRAAAGAVCVRRPTSAE
jgi:hypothetical protein